MRAKVIALCGLACAGCGIHDISDAPVSAPFAVSDYYSPSGYFGDGSLTTAKPIVMSAGSGCAPRPAGARGVCYRFDYQPVASSAGGQGFGGVYFLSPAGNWGQELPLAVVSNATRVSFYAAGASGGEHVQFLAGGIAATDPDKAPLPYVDSVKATLDLVLTTELTRYELTLPAGVSYDYVLGGFAWSATAPAGAAPVHVYLDDIAWEK